MGSPRLMYYDPHELEVLDFGMARHKEQLLHLVRAVERWLPNDVTTREALQKNRVDLLPQLITRAAALERASMSTHQSLLVAGVSCTPVTRVKVRYRRLVVNGPRESTAQIIQRYGRAISALSQELSSETLRLADAIMREGDLEAYSWATSKCLSRDAHAFVLLRMVFEGVASCRLVGKLTPETELPPRHPLVMHLSAVAPADLREHLVVVLHSIREHLDRLTTAAPTFDELAVPSIPFAVGADGLERNYLIWRHQVGGFDEYFTDCLPMSAFTKAVVASDSPSQHAAKSDWCCDPAQAFRNWMAEAGAVSRSHVASQIAGKRTSASYRGLFNQFLRYVGSKGTTVLDATPDIVQGFIDSAPGRGGPPSMATTEKRIMLLRRVYQQLVRQELVAVNPAALITARSTESKAPEETSQLSVQEYANLVAYLEKLPTSTSDECRRAALLALMSSCGALAGELASAQVDQLCVSENGLVLKLPAVDRRRAADISVPRWAGRIVEKWLLRRAASDEWLNSTKLFPSFLNSQSGLSPRTAQRYVRQAMSAIGRSERVGAVRVLRLSQESLILQTAGAVEMEKAMRLKTGKMTSRHQRRRAMGSLH